MIAIFLVAFIFLSFWFQGSIARPQTLTGVSARQPVAAHLDERDRDLLPVGSIEPSVGLACFD
jgi:hypothetical protein